ncbi:MAG: branched-subunit amino acid transport protein [Colwellia sp.]|jgi:branched-subunit amino acid transport protein|tara:strand:- start:17493 stop:17813 length:321 start_codon:yes stop_codon:yes gene_type:complete
MNDFWLALLGMTCITFSCRYFFFSTTFPFKLGPKVTRLLSYTAPSVLTAMWVPIVFLGHQESNSDFISSPFLIAGVATVIFSLKIKNTLAVVLFGMSVFGLLKILF